MNSYSKNDPDIITVISYTVLQVTEFIGNLA